MNYLLRHEAAIDLRLALGIEDRIPQRLQFSWVFGDDRIPGSTLCLFVSVLTAAFQYNSFKIPRSDRRTQSSMVSPVEWINATEDKLVVTK